MSELWLTRPHFQSVTVGAWRPLRIECPCALDQLTSRGDCQEAIFEDDRDHPDFLNDIEVVGAAVFTVRWLCHALCLMGNHYHLMIETADLTKSMRQLNGVFTQWSQ